MRLKKYLEYFSIMLVCLLSFYYTEKVALYVKNKNPLMQEIKAVKDELYVNFINSQVIDDLYIIPGINGRELNANLSYSKMQEEQVFNENKLIFDTIKPEISIKDNKDKIIIRGNGKKRHVSLVFEDYSNLTKYMGNLKYEIDVLISKEEYNEQYELINNAKVEETYKNIDSFLKKQKKDNNLCMTLNDELPSLCKNKYIFKPSLIVSHANISTAKKEITSGEIILVKNSLSITELNVLINQIKYQDLKIVPLSTLISEEYNED